MNRIPEIYANSEISEASYADFRPARQSDGTYKDSEVETALIASGFSQTQAADFVARWRVVDHQPNTTLTGFSATLFQRLDGAGNPLPEYSLAIRGTEFSLFSPTDTDLRDLVVDAALAAGLVPQKADLEAYYSRLVAEGTLSADQPLTVTGHSLGGFLAQLFAADHAGVAALGADARPLLAA